MPHLEPLYMNTLKRAKTILFTTAKELAKGHSRKAAPRWSAPAEPFLMCASPSYLSVGPRRLDGIGVEEITKSAKKYTRAKKKGIGLCSGTRTTGIPHTTMIDKRNGLKGILGTRIIHVLCPLRKSLSSLQWREKQFRKEETNKSCQIGTGSSEDEGEKERCSHNDLWAGT